VARALSTLPAKSCKLVAVPLTARPTVGAFAGGDAAADGARLSD